MGIHAYLLWADFGWIGEIPSLKPKPQMCNPDPGVPADAEN